MDGFRRKSLPNLGFATFDLFAAFLADALGKVREETCHCPQHRIRVPYEGRKHSVHPPKSIAGV